MLACRMGAREENAGATVYRSHTAQLTLCGHDSVSQVARVGQRVDVVLSTNGVSDCARIG